MANNRLYIVDRENKEYCCIAKHDGARWNLGNVDLLKEFLEERFNDSGTETKLVLLSEYNKELCELEKSEDSYNYNQSNKWEYE